MRDIVFNGIPSIQGKSADQALQVLYRHCQETAELVMAMNREIEALKDEVEQLRLR